MDTGALEYAFADEYYEDLWFDVPETYTVTDNESSEQATFEVVTYDGDNWQERPVPSDERLTVTATERRFLGTTCPILPAGFHKRADCCKVSVRTRRMH